VIIVYVFPENNISDRLGDKAVCEDTGVEEITQRFFALFVKHFLKVISGPIGLDIVVTARDQGRSFIPGVKPRNI